MISEKEMMDYLSGKMSDEMKKVFLKEMITQKNLLVSLAKKIQ